VTSFDTLDLIEPIRRALRDENYTTPTPIQAQAIPHLLQRRDLLGIAQTGTGKTAAFLLPLLQHLSAERRNAGARTVRTLVLTPTRELAIQIGDSARRYGRHLALRGAIVFGGVGQNPQVQVLSKGVDLLVATPGRLLDLLEQGHVRLDAVEFFVLDEADRMLDMGFIRDIRKIITTLPKRRQTLFFSATMPPAISELAAGILTDPIRVEVTPVSSTVELIDQRVLFVERADKRALLTAVLRDPAVSRMLVFTRTKHGANKVVEQLGKDGFVAEAIHGNKSQGARQRALESFREGKCRVLVATDIAARGIDVDGITHVVNYDLPVDAESYVHRIGRTARAGASGHALSFCSSEERGDLRDIERLIKREIPVADIQPFGLKPSTAPASVRPERQQGGRPRQAGGRRRRG